MPPEPADQVRQWAADLLDPMDRHNRLLCYRAQTGTIAIRQVEDAVVATLLGGRAVPFYRPAAVPDQGPERSLEDVLAIAPPRANDLVANQRDPREIDKKLKAMATKAREHREDRGTHVLYFSWGRLTWTYEGKEWAAPVLLVPVALARDGERHTLCRAEGYDPTWNPMLSIRLRTDFNIDIPNTDLEPDGNRGVAAIRDSVQQTLEQARNAIPGAALAWDASLDLFSTPKDDMYNDLRDNAANVAQHPLIGRLCGVQGEEIRALVPPDVDLDGLSKWKSELSVLEADESQRRAILAANSGESFVLIGPPGTGKSQTIANIIANFIWQGKSVLFVSEKMAALDVVYKRLQEVDLQSTVLQLHDAKAARGAVARELATALDENIQIHDIAQDAEGQFGDARETLNSYVRALHKPRRPDGFSAFEVLAELATLSGAPKLPGPAVDAQRATKRDLRAVTAEVERLSMAWEPTEQTDFPWRDVLPGHAKWRKTRDSVASAMKEAKDSVQTMEMLDRQVAQAFNWNAAPCQDTRRARTIVGDSIQRRLPCPVEWLAGDADPARLRTLLVCWEARGAEHARLQAELARAYGERWRELPHGLAAELDGVMKALRETVGPEVDLDSLMAHRGTALDCLRELDGAVGDVDRVINDLAPRFGMTAACSAHDADVLAAIARMSQTTNRPARGWLLSAAGCNDVETFLREHGGKYEEQREAWDELAACYEEELLDLDLEPLSERMTRCHGHWWSWFRPRHRADRRAVAALTRVRTLLPNVAEDLRKAVRVHEQRRRLAELKDQARSVLGPYAQGLETRVDAVADGLAAARELHTILSPQAGRYELAAAAAAESAYDPRIERLTAELEQGMTRVEVALGRLAALHAVVRQRYLDGCYCAALTEWMQRLRGGIEDLARLMQAVAPPGGPQSLGECLERARQRIRVHELEVELERDEAELRGGLGEHYTGFDTRWKALTEALGWACELRGTFRGPLPLEVAERVLKGHFDELPWRAYSEALDALDARSKAVARVFAERARQEVLDTLCGPADGATAWARRRVEAEDSLHTWDRYLEARRKLRRLGWDEFCGTAIAKGTQRNSLVPAARRAWLGAWFDSVERRVSVLRGFHGQTHLRAVSRFQDLDRQQIQQGREHVLAAYVRNKPGLVEVPGAEQTTIRTEAAKRRKHKSVRELLSGVPVLLPKLKPCVMMSPLSVSRFLPARRGLFDLVVFDEASQVRPEEALNCIYRGNQLILAGDPKQMPPTAYFQRTTDEAEDGEEAEGEQPPKFESVLAAGSEYLPKRNLEWHYRSRHDALIRFVNQHMYGGSLVTFPSACAESDALGVKFVHVPDGVYGRGTTQQNPREAARVVELVAEHLRTNPQLSIGVVAFGEKQRKAIKAALEAKERECPEIAQGSKDRLEQLFVKNLETVQGDERDVIILSVGYGRGENGTLGADFGPLNKHGGERRLNVAVTRARRKVVVVSSITGRDMPAQARQADPSLRGRALLRAYLSYAETGELPREPQPRAVDRVPRHLENDVAGVVRGFGYEVEEAVGGGIYRVDLGVRSRARPGEFTLAVECDGEMYKRAKTARDRDRLREAVLRGLRWRVHRIWAPDWCFRREEEVKRLRTAITEAEEQPPGDGNGGRAQVAPLETRAVVARAGITVDSPRTAVEAGWAIGYQRSEVGAYDVGSEFDKLSHLPRVVALVKAEGPVHHEYVITRLRRAAGLGRKSPQFRESVLGVISLCCRRETRLLEQRGDFVWPGPCMPEAPVLRVRVPGRADTDRRRIDEIPPEEIELLMLFVARAAPNIAREELKTLVGRIFGFERIGRHIEASLEERVRGLLGEQKLQEEAGGLSLGANCGAVPLVEGQLR